MEKDPVEEFLDEIEGLVKNRRRYDDWQLDHMELEKVLSHQRELVPKLLVLVRIYRDTSHFGKEDVLMAANCIQCMKDGNDNEETWGKLRATRHTFFSIS